MRTIHAPWENLTTATMTSTNPVVTAPTALRTTDRRHPGSRVRGHFRTIPVWLRVNDRKTPTTYNWISRLTSASKRAISSPAPRARVTTPLEKTRRSPRLRYWRGIIRWAARIAESRGKSW